MAAAKKGEKGKASGSVPGPDGASEKPAEKGQQSKKTVTKKSGSKKKSAKSAGKGEKAPAKKTAKRKGRFECQYCGKVITTAHNLKVHEQHCKKKIDDKDKRTRDNEIEAAVRKLKDEFDDQRERLERDTLEREDLLRDEIRELKEILRLEIRRTHHADIPHPARKPDGPPPEKPQESPTEKRDPPAVPKVEHLDFDLDDVDVTDIQKEHAPIPKVVVPPPEHPVLEHDEIIDETSEDGAKTAGVAVGPTVPAEVGEVGAGSADVGRVPPKADRVPPEAEVSAPVAHPDDSEARVSAGPEELAELIRSEIEKLGLSVDAAARKEQHDGVPEEMVSRVDALSAELSEFRRETRERHDRLSRKIDERLRELNVKRYERDLEKISERVFDIMEEVGFGESLDVSKIPPNILEIVYQATLEDVVREMIRSLGSQEAERKINDALEEVRLKTSGSELFRFDGRRVATDNLAQSLENNLISAKQIQTTYTELLNKLLDSVPHYKAKNFRAMIKIKSQEYAVDKATVLMEEVERLGNFAETTSHMIAALSSQVNSRALKTENEFDRINAAVDAKIGMEEMEQINNRFDDRMRAESRFSEEIGTLKAEVEMLRQLIGEFERRLDVSAEPRHAPGKKRGVKDESAKEEKKKVVADEHVSVGDKDGAGGNPVEKIVLAEIGKGASSKTAVIKASGLKKNEVERALAALVKSKSIVKKGPDSRPVYSTPEDDFAEVVNKSGKKDDEKKAERKKTEKKDIKKEEKKAPAKKDDAKKAVTEEGGKAGKKAKREDAVKKDGKEGADNEKAGERGAEKDAKTKGERPKAGGKKRPAKKGVKEKKEPVKDDGKGEGKKADEIPAGSGDSNGRGPAEETGDGIVEEKKTLGDLTKDEKLVYDAIPEAGITLPNLRKNVEKDVKYTVVLRTLRVLIDSGLIDVKARGRHTMYHKINVTKKEKTDKNKNRKEVK